MDKINTSFTSIELANRQYLKNRTATAEKVDTGLSFGQILNQSQAKVSTSDDVKFSKHALMRLQNRDISLSAEQRGRLVAGVQKASEKGINESLIMVDSLAFIVNIPNKIVITAMDQMESDDSIFTNIDGAVIM